VIAIVARGAKEGGRGETKEGVEGEVAILKSRGAEAIVSGGLAGTSDCNDMGMVGWRVESAVKGGGARKSLSRTKIGPGLSHVTRTRGRVYTQHSTCL
jgi:hypothetical protein